MLQAHTEIQRLERLRQGAELERALLEARGALSPSERGELLALERRREQLEHRIAWFQAILREHT